MELLIGTSIVAAFITGVAALFAPCCITVLLPSYFASIFRERTKVFLMTFIFFLGMLTVYFPLGLGVAALGQVFSRFHNIILSVGSVFLIALAVMLLTGVRVSLPMFVHPSLKRHNAPSVYFLGILSGIATTCCAPVLAGVLALAAMPGSVFWGSVYTVSYVLGMVAPLFLLSLFLDTVGFAQKFRQVFRRPITYPLWHKRVSITFADALSGVTFLVMGALTITLALMNRLFVHSVYQIKVNIAITRIIRSLQDVVGNVPPLVWALVIFLILGLIIVRSLTSFSSDSHEE